MIVVKSKGKRKVLWEEKEKEGCVAGKEVDGKREVGKMATAGRPLQTS
jgi:hypothetical protein